MSLDVDLFIDSREDSSTTISRLEETLHIKLTTTGEKVERDEDLLGHCLSHTLKLGLYLNTGGYGTRTVLDNGIHLSTFPYYLTIHRVYGRPIAGDVYAVDTCIYWGEVLHHRLKWNTVGMENIERVLYCHHTQSDSDSAKIAT